MRLYSDDYVDCAKLGLVDSSLNGLTIRIQLDLFTIFWWAKRAFSNNTDFFL
jgi:hypothetical protein